MPGKVLQVLVKEGDVVEEGQPLLVLEAMKMENVIKAAANGTVSVVASKAKRLRRGLCWWDLRLDLRIHFPFFLLKTCQSARPVNVQREVTFTP